MDNQDYTEEKEIIKEDIKPERDIKDQAASVMMKGATILAIAGIVSKIFGAIFRIPLTNLIGAEGQSYYGAAYPVYQFFYVIASAGFPIAISRMVSERAAKGDYINAQKSFRIALRATMVICFLSFLIIFFGAEAIASFVKNPGAAASLRATSFAILFTSVVASLRGYFQGMQNMVPTALTEVVEQMTRVIIGLGLAYTFYKTSLENAAAGATFGASAGMIAAMLVLLIIYSKDKEARQERFRQSVVRVETDRELFTEMINIIVPITIGSSIMPLMMIIDNSIIMRKLLASGWSFAESKTLYGLISGYCDPLVNMPVVFIEAVCISLMPAVTRAFTLGNKNQLNENVKAGLKTMMIIAYPCAIGLLTLAKPILHMLYPMKPLEADMAVGTLRVMSVTVITLSAMRVLSTSLQGVGKMAIPVYNLGIGALVKIFMTYTLVGIRFMNIKGAALGTVMAFLVSALLNYRALKKCADVNLNLYDIFIKPFLSAAIMGIFTYGNYAAFFALSGRNSISTLISIMVAVAVYFILIFKMSVLTRDEIELIPKGDLIFKIAGRLRLVK